MVQKIGVANKLVTLNMRDNNIELTNKTFCSVYSLYCNVFKSCLNKNNCKHIFT
jgi:hypothetical protein